MTPSRSPLPTQPRRSRLALPALLLLAALPRLWGLGRLPPGLQFDEAHNALDALRVLDGARDLFFVDNGGREPLAVYLQALILAVLGEDRPQQALRLVSALAGLGGIAAAYGWAREFLGRRLPALGTAGFLAVSYWHLHFSRYGIRAILAPLCVTLALWGWWKATRPGVGATGGRPYDGGGGGGAALACGAAMAAAVYAHPTGRLLPLVLLGHLAFLARRHPARLRQGFRSLLVSGGVALLLFLPLGFFFVRHPVWFVSHPGDVSLAAVAEAQFDGSLSRTFLHQLWAVAGMFFVSGDPSAFHNLPCLPVWDPLSALLGLLGLGLLAAALLGEGRGGSEDRGDNRGGGTSPVGAADAGREQAVFLFVWLTVFLLPTLLSDRAPNYSRAIAALPVIALFPALGAEWLSGGLSRRGRPGWAAALLPLSLGVAGAWTLWHYALVFGRQSPLVCGTDRRLDLYHSYDLDKRDAYAYLAGRAAGGAAVFLHPLWAGHASFAYLNRHGPVRSLDPRETLVLPAGVGPLLLAAPAKEAEAEAWFGPFRDAGQATQTLRDPEGRPLLELLEVPRRETLGAGDRDEGAAVWGASGRTGPARLGTFPLRPTMALRQPFADGLLLEGLHWEPPQPGSPLRLHLFWRVASAPTRDWTAFVQLIGPEDQSWGQADRQPGGGSFPTSAWRQGDWVIQRLEPLLDGAARGPLRLRLGWYEPQSGERQPLLQKRSAQGLPAGTAVVDGGTALLLDIGSLAERP